MTTTRRDLLTGSVALVAAPLLPLSAAPAAAMTVADPAIAAYQQWRTARDEHERALDEQTIHEHAYFANRNDPVLSMAYDMAWERNFATSDHQIEMMEILRHTPALTLSGVLAKLIVVELEIKCDYPGDLEPIEPWLRLVLSAIRDLRCVAAGGAA